jgi:4-hydroxybenzoyl-CoA thioesterase/acyl-CoA thioester hydrolase
MAAPFKTQRRIEFCETDAAGIAHFSAFFPYMEQAEHAMFRQLGLSVVLKDEQGVLSWPRVKAACEYRGAVKFEDLLDISVAVARLGTRSATYAFEFTHEGRVVATGSVTSVCCRIVPGEPPRSVSIPDWIAEKLRTYCRSETD